MVETIAKKCARDEVVLKLVLVIRPEIKVVGSIKKNP